MKVTYSITKEDYWNACKYITYNTRGFKLCIAVSFLLGVLASVLIYYVTYSMIKAVVIPLTAFLLTLYIKYLHSKKKVYKNAEDQRSTILIEKTIELKEEGILSVSNFYNTVFKWISVSSIKITDKYLIIFFNRVTVIIIPKRIFSSEDEAIQFYNTATIFMEKSKK